MKSTRPTASSVAYVHSSADRKAAMFWRHVFVIVIAVLAAFLAPELASADPKIECAKLYSQIVEVPNGGPVKLTLEQYRTKLEELRKLFKGLKSPEFGLYLGVKEPEFAHVENVVMVPTNIAPRLTKVHHVETELAMLSHEIGHAVFEKNLSASHLKLSTLNPQIANTAESVLKFENEYKILLSNQRNMPDNQFQALNADLQRRAGPVVANFQRLRQAEWALVATHELFADLTAAVAKKDPKINMRSTRAAIHLLRGETGNPDLVGNFRVRDFSRAFRPNELPELWSSRVAVDSFYADPHTLFAPSKKSIWDLISPSLAQEGKREEVLGRIFTVLQDVLRRQYPDTRSLANSSLNPVEINQKLLEAMKREFSR